MKHLVRKKVVVWFISSFVLWHFKTIFPQSNLNRLFCHCLTDIPWDKRNNSFHANWNIFVGTDDSQFCIHYDLKESKTHKKMNEYPVGIYLLKINNRNTRSRCEICSKLTIKTRTCSFTFKFGTYLKVDSYYNKIYLQFVSQIAKRF